MNPWQASRAAGVSHGYARKLDRRWAGCTDPPEAPYSGRSLDREERYEIARLPEAGLTIRQVAARVGRQPSTMWRELARNADPARALQARAGRPAGTGAAASAEGVEAGRSPELR